jgi:hypothetical protein
MFDCDSAITVCSDRILTANSYIVATPLSIALTRWKGVAELPTSDPYANVFLHPACTLVSRGSGAKKCRPPTSSRCCMRADGNPGFTEASDNLSIR